jgi:hypothetical protein
LFYFTTPGQFLAVAGLLVRHAAVEHLTHILKENDYGHSQPTQGSGPEHQEGRIYR